MKASRKRAFGVLLVLAVLLLLSSCNFMYGLFNPLLGTWEGPGPGGGGATISMTFNWDDTFTLSQTDGSTTISGSGTYTQDSSAGTITVVVPSDSQLTQLFGATSSTFSYSISGNQLTISSAGDSFTLTKK